MVSESLSTRKRKDYCSSKGAYGYSQVRSRFHCDDRSESLSHIIKHTFYVLTHGPQSCIEGIPGVDPHIGGNELHRACYDTLQMSWYKWSKGYCVPLERTMLWGLKVYALIAGKAHQQPANERDAILDYFITMRKNGE